MRVLNRLLAPLAVVGTVVLLAGPAQAAPNDQDTSWVQAAHLSNLAEIAAGNAAQQQATTQEVKDLGAMFVQMHTQLDSALAPVAQQLGIQLQPEPTAEQQAQLKAVQANTGRAFDTAWIAQQIGSHSTTLAATQQELKAGQDPTVLAQAQTATPVVQQHLDELRALAGQYGVPTSVPAGSGGQAADGGLPTSSWALIGVGGAALLAGGAGLVRRRATQA